MKKRFMMMTLLVMISFVVSGCGKKIQEQEQTQNQEQEQKQESKMGSIKGTFQELMKQGNQLRCEFSFKNEQGETKGIAYTDGTRMRQEVSMNQKNVKMENFMIVKDEEVYSWNSMQPGQGMKINLKDWEDKRTNEETVDENQEASIKTSTMDQSYEYNCEAWDVDESKFEIPSNVKFMDMGAMMKAFQPGNKNGANSEEKPQGNDNQSLNQQACGVCQYAPNQEECRKELNCQ